MQWLRWMLRAAPHRAAAAIWCSPSMFWVITRSACRPAQGGQGAVAAVGSGLGVHQVLPVIAEENLRPTQEESAAE